MAFKPNLSALANLASGPAFTAISEKTGIPASTLKASAKLASSARKGNPKARKAVKQIAAKAKKGDPKAKKTLKTIQVANKVQKAQEKKIAPIVQASASTYAPGDSLHMRGVKVQRDRAHV